jgi:hypothetical protein
MKPIERIAAVTDHARLPVAVVTTNPLTAEPNTYTLPAEQFRRLLALAGEAAWASGFIARLWEEAEEAARYAKATRDDTYPVHPDKVNYEAGEEPGDPDRWSQGFHEGAQHVRDMLAQLLHTDPEHFAPDDTSFRTPDPGPPVITTARATVLEFDPEPEGER